MVIFVTSFRITWKKLKMNDKIFISSFLEVKDSSIPGAGFGVFTTQDIPALTIVEQARVKLIHHEVLHHTDLSDTWLNSYSFSWTQEVACLCFGFGCLYNHSNDFNLDYKCIPDPQSLQFMAVRDIKKGEELFIRYFPEANSHYESNWIERTPEERWKKAEDEYLDSLYPDHRLERQPSEYIQRRKKNRVGSLKTMSSLFKKS